MKHRVPNSKILITVQNLKDGYGVSLTSRQPMNNLQDAFERTASATPGAIQQVEYWGLDWDNLSNDKFLKNASYSNTHCLLRDWGTMEFGLENGEWTHQSTCLNPEHTNRLSSAVYFAKNWIDEQSEKYEEPRILEIPQLFKTIIWIPGALKDTFILAQEFHTKPSDPFVIDENLFDSVKKELQERLEQYKQASKNQPPGSGPLGG